MCILSSLFVGFIDKNRVDVVADMILSPLGFVLAFILRYTGICGILERPTEIRIIMIVVAVRAFSWCE